MMDNNITSLGDQVGGLVRERDSLQTQLDSANRMIDLLRQQHAEVSEKYTKALRRHGQEVAELEAERDFAKQRAQAIYEILMATAGGAMQGLRAWKGDETPKADFANLGHNHPALRSALGEA